MICRYCKNDFKVNTYGKNILHYIPPVCSLYCLYQYINTLPNKPKRYYTVVTKVRPFQSRLEEIFYNTFKKYWTLYYEPYILNQGNTIYIPDFYIKEKDLFIEVKGQHRGLNKFKKFAREYPILIVFKEVFQNGCK